MSLGLIAGFLAVCLIAYLTPGPDWFVIMRYTAVGKWTGFISSLGVQAGLALHMLAASLGVTAFALAGAAAFTALKLAGAAYLVFLGAQSLVKLRTTRGRSRGTDRAPDESIVRLPAVFWKSFLANALNPQAAIFFVAVLPQFIDPTTPLLAQVALLGALDIGLGILWWIVYIYAIALIRGAMGARTAHVVLNAVAGGALIVLGLALAFIDPVSINTD